MSTLPSLPEENPDPDSLPIVDVSAFTGYYRVGPLAPGRYQLLYTPRSRTGLGPIYHGNVTEQEDAPFIDVTYGDIVADLDVALTEAVQGPVDPIDSGRIYLPTLGR